MNRAEITEQLRQRGWTIEEGAPAPFELPTAVADRHPRLPSALIEFLSGLSTCANQDETAWFLCQRDYNGTSDSAFHWDEFEQMSIDSARDDQKTLTEIRCFWDAHLPFLLSVRGGYAFYAVRTTSDRFGEVVEGNEPIFEEASVVASSFTEFITRFLTESQHERLSPIVRNV